MISIMFEYLKKGWLTAGIYFDSFAGFTNIHRALAPVRSVAANLMLHFCTLHSREKSRQAGEKSPQFA